jgi:hypothetical protein
MTNVLRMIIMQAGAVPVNQPYHGAAEQYSCNVLLVR